ncbi:gamma-interferon-inducible protein 16-like isoform X2 [Callospermophilus lateralis]|uniref:gamma-interferon-inducible protein 16-like isoform X2 n=1 Tax=Callospermophilus lateralis TaxID=76772 RepID=UPI004038BB71
MVNEYKKIVLLKGLEVISDYHFSMVKSLLAKELKLTRKMQDEYNRIKIADLLEDKFQNDAGLNKLISVLKDIPMLEELAGELKKEKMKVKPKTPVKKKQEVDPVACTSITRDTMKTPESQKRKKANLEKTETKKTKISGSKTIKMPEDQTRPSCSALASVTASMDHFLPAQVPALTPFRAPPTENQKKAQCHLASRRSVLHKGPMIVMVLKATDPFEYESAEEGKSSMFHATVATENQFFQVKVFNTNLKEKFTKNKIITISNYVECKGILEVNEVSVVSEAGLDQKIEVPSSVIKRANETPKIDHLHKQAPGTLVYGLFMLHKKKVNKKNTIYEIQDNTGKIDVMGSGKWHNIQCDEGNKLRLFCFQLKTINKKLTLVCGDHSFIKEMEATNSKTNNGKVQESQGQRQLPQLSEIGIKPPQCIIHTPQKPPTAPPSSVHTPQKPPTAPSSSVHTPQNPPTAPPSSVHTPQKPPTAPPSSVHTPQNPPTAPSSHVHTPHKPPTAPSSSVHTHQKPPTAPSSHVHTPQKPPTAPSSSVHIPQKPPTAPSSSVHTPQKPPTAPPSSVHTPQNPPTAPPSSVHTPQMPPTATSGKTNTFHLLLTLPSGVQTSHLSPPNSSGRIQTPHFSSTSSRGIQGPHTSPTSCSKIQTPQMPLAAPDGRTPTPHLPRTSPSECQTTHVSLTSSSRVQTPHMCPGDPSGRIQTPHFSPTSSRGIQTPQTHPTEPSTIIQNPQVWPATPSASLQTLQKTVTSFSSGLPTNPRLKTVPKEASEEHGHQKGPKEVVVLKVTEPFTYEFKEGGKKMFHATVATESEFFRVKVFDIHLKDKFIPKTVIAISDYIGRNGFLEVYSASTVSHVSTDRKMEISKTLIKNANATPKIEYLCSRSTTKYVNGVYMVYKKNVREDCTYYEIQDDTGKMEVVVYGRLTYINCEEGDKLNLFCFELTLNADKWQLRSVFHSYIKVIKANKSKICPLNRDSNMDTSQESFLKPEYY